MVDNLLGWASATNPDVFPGANDDPFPWLLLLALLVALLLLLCCGMPDCSAMPAVGEGQGSQDLKQFGMTP